ncbi:hypothetical protein ACF1BQ_019590 [Bradyrhizobium sp. RDT10]
MYAEPWQLYLLPIASNKENKLLESVAAERKPNSRLSYQIRASEHIDALVLYLPDRQSQDGN